LISYVTKGFNTRNWKRKNVHVNIALPRSEKSNKNNHKQIFMQITDANIRQRLTYCITVCELGSTKRQFRNHRFSNQLATRRERSGTYSHSLTAHEEMHVRRTIDQSEDTQNGEHDVSVVFGDSGVNDGVAGFVLCA
jgi:hypothetical protein